ncbi:MAG: glycerol kinase GlpK [Candidatus Hydrogenedentes bacterium]|nr:glycerol kinase GlpK [Candidatus Hydrogenedentota bacterium]
MAKRFVLALDQGTTSSRSILFDYEGNVVAVEQQEFKQYYPRPGWVEHDPYEIWNTQLSTARAVLKKGGVSADEIAGIGITNQRETTVIWDKKTGSPVYPAIVWQCRRTASICEQLKAEGTESEIRKRTGLVIDAYFSGTKIRWILDNVSGVRNRAEKGEIAFGTIDSWLLYQLTGEHATDYSNASRTLIFNIHTLDWDDIILQLLKIPRAILPQVYPSSHIYGVTEILGKPIPVSALIGDQQSALFGQTAYNTGECKNTYGTGCFLLMNTGESAPTSEHGLLTTIGWGISNKITYALEGSVFVGGAVVQWLRDELKIINSASETEEIANSVPDTGGVYLVPAFVGLGAPFWDMHARGIICGITRGTSKAHIVRAALESISFQSADVVFTMEQDSKISISQLRVDGGAAGNNFLLQHQANILGKPVIRGHTLETTALGCAYLAGLATGFWKSQDELKAKWKVSKIFEPKWSEDQRLSALEGWHKAVAKALTK